MTKRRDQSGPRILLVEDHFLLALHMGEHLKLDGCRLVGPAYNLEQALDLVRGTPVDVALIDVNLGESTSYPVAEALIEKGIPFAFLSGHSKQDLEPRYRSHMLIAKPVHPDALSKAVRELVGQIPSR